MNSKLYCSLGAALLAFLIDPGSLFAQLTPGDINGDGKVDSSDIARGVQIALGKLPPATQSELASGDINRDGRITVQDLVFISNTIAGLNRPPVADISASDDSGTVGVPVNLDASLSFDLDEDTLTYRWRQLFGPKVSFEYTSHTETPIEDTTKRITIFTPKALGHYKLELEVTDSNGLIDRDTIRVFVESDPTARALAVKGVIPADAWFQELYLPGLAATVTRVKKTHAEYFSFWYFSFVTLKDSLPVIEPIPPTVPNTTPDRNVQKQIVDLYHEAGFKVQWIFIFEFDHPFGIGNPIDYCNQWAEEFKQKIAIQQASYLDSLGVEMILLQDFPTFGLGDSTLNQNIFLPKINDAMTSFRQNFSGQIGLTELLFGPKEGTWEGVFNFSIIDFGQPQFHRQLYQNFDFCEISFQPNITEHLNDPSVEQLRNQFELIMNNYIKPVEDVIQKPIYLQLIFPCFDGANKNTSLIFSGTQNPYTTPIDFQEQVDMYEALFQAIDDKAYIEGIFSRGFSYFDLNYTLDELGQPIFSLDTPLDPSSFSAIHHSIRNKPATEALRLQFINR
ncbi:MAG: dockerin type I domain-containing protein [bacterium]